MRLFENLSEQELTEEFERCNKEASTWHEHAVAAANSGDQIGMLYHRDYEEKAAALWRRAAQIVTEMRVYRGNQDFARDPSGQQPT